jgi:WD40 repeat protein
MARIRPASGGFQQSKIVSFPRQRDTIRNVAFSPDGSLLASASSSGQAKVWRAPHWREVAEFGDDGAAAEEVCFSPDGKYLAATFFFRAVVWDLATGQRVATLAHGRTVVWSAAFSHDGKTLVTATIHGDLRWWDLESGAERFPPKRHKRSVYSVSVSPDGKHLAAGGLPGDAGLAIWDMATGKKVRALEGHEGGVVCVRFSPDGAMLATAAGGDYTVCLWDVASRRQLGVLKVSSFPWQVSFLDGGKGIAITTGASVSLHDVSSIIQQKGND